MTQAEKLEALIQKAVDGGWKPGWSTDILNFKLQSSLVTEEITLSWNYRPEWAKDDNNYCYTVSLASIIFDHDFARALFPEDITYVHSGYERYAKGRDVQSWLGPAKEAIKDDDFMTGAISYTTSQYHLQQAVISKDPIGYMYKEVFGDGL